MTIFNCDWGGDVTFSSPQLTTRGTTYFGTTSLTKNGASNNNSVGGNRFIGNTTLTNAGSGQIIMANTSPDTFDLDLSIINSGTNNFFLGNTSAGNVVSGNLTATNSATGGSNLIYFTNTAALH